MGRIYTPLRTRKRKEILHQAFFHALSQETEKAMEESIRSSITPETFEDYRSMRDARRIVREPLGRCYKEGLQLLSERDRWMLFPLNRRMEGLLYAIPFEIFGPGIFEEGVRTGYRMVVRKEDFSKRLPSLYKRLTEEGIQLFFDDQPLRIAKWDFELDATRSTIDWFEIRPEIRCEGSLIDEALWEQALSQCGIIERNGVLEILDEESLQKLAALYERVRIRSTAKREIVRVPRLHIFDWILLRKNGIQVKLAPEDERILGRLSHFEKIEERSMPEGLKVSLRGYQKEGHAWLSFLYENRFGACLADDMGLGKTLQALSLLAGIKEGMIESSNKFVHTHLVVVPPSLLFNWEREIEKFYPDFKVYPYQGKERTVDFRGFDLVLTTYGLIRRDIDKLKEIYFDVVIFDEAQAIKNIYADTTGAVRQIKASFKLALTGTPVENHIGEYYSIMDLVLPGLLGEYDQFKSQARKETSSFFDIVIARTKPFILRRTKEETLRELPPKIETDFYLDLTEKQKSLYNKTVEAVKSTIDEAYRTKTTSQAKIIALTALLKLRQICLSPQLLIPETEEVSPKIDFLKARLMKLYDEGHHALVFSQFTSFLDIVEKEIKDRGFHLLRLDGSTPVNKRKGLVESFQKSDHPTVFLLSLKAGGQGLNLTKATYVFHLDPWWNPAVESQASDRAHRIGQKNTVIITRILMKHTIEEKMMELKKRKRKLYEAILESPSQGSRLSITKEDFEFLLSGA
jgi:non-specific serine/threonine protein kinase